MTTLSGPHYLLTAIIYCRAENGRRIPWSPPLIKALEASPLMESGWKKTSNVSFALDIPFEGADPATGEEAFITEIQAIKKEGTATKGIADLRVSFQCNTVVVYDELPPIKKGGKKGGNKDDPSIATIDLRRRTAHI